MLGSPQLETTRTVGLLLLVALVCSAAALYLLMAGVDGNGALTTPAVSDTSLPHAFPGGS